MSVHLHLESPVTWVQLREILAPHIEPAGSADRVTHAILRRAAKFGRDLDSPEELSSVVSWLNAVGLTVGTIPMDLADSNWTLDTFEGFSIRAAEGSVWDPLMVALITVMARSQPNFSGLMVWSEERRNPTTGALLLRVIGYDREAATGGRAPAVLLTTNIDDMSAEIVAYVLERLLREGARDAWISPVVMKKSRAAMTLNVLASLDYESAALRVIFEETTTLGVRRTLIDTYMLERRLDLVTTMLGQVHVKAGFFDGKLRSLHPEFEDCALLARRYGVPLQHIYRQAVQQWWADHPLERDHERHLNR